MNQPTTLDLTGGWENIVNLNHDCAAVMRRIDRDLDCDILAKNLNAISARRRKKGKK